ncbi:hypothetical protein WN48_08296 [Eufriesea mexicana]|uniref:Uncharacterized protein n=1 Tax=Eufriesea mexicana TaxID=516756 RepID=A0A310SBI0_9HYME|nr:hypothetical protein WN48_08296 [Eufriesea mexicana]
MQLGNPDRFSPLALRVMKVCACLLTITGSQLRDDQLFPPLQPSPRQNTRLDASHHHPPCYVGGDFRIGNAIQGGCTWVAGGCADDARE